MFRMMAALLIGFVLVGEPTNDAVAGDTLGVVLLHGKGGTSRPKSPIGRLAALLGQVGFMVATPDMPWSRSRYLTKDYEESLKEIDAAVAGLKRKGARKIVVGGHSMGGNAALGYGARRDGLAGVMVLAPGHTPSDYGYQATLNNDYRRAQAMIANGRGNTVAEFNDNNQGKRRSIKFKAGVYLSWFDPQGPATMPLNAEKLSGGTALLWVVGRKDRMWLKGESYAFVHAPAHPKKLYLEVLGGHKETPTAAAQQIITWLKRL